ncbi:HamA C-terminal domain-containing protein [Pseudarthrobacter sp. YS3]|uniref:HamA C-terminal domain-containing protein n=1 Tax=Pseudarthrobacter sp. YS3 TaxID=3453718 RepID=UPI003EEC4531
MVASLSDDDLARALKNMARNNPGLFESTLHHGAPTLLSGTKTTVRTHYILSDATGNVRLAQLAEVLADQIVFFCIPRSDIKALLALPEHQRVTANNRLYRRAKDTFAEAQPMTGEGSELLLFALLENVLEVPQLMTKMSLKTSENVHVHGADAVHAVLDEDTGNLALYWGEAKMYEDVGDALSACFKSLEPFLRMDWDVIRRDQWLVMHYLDTADEEVKLRLLRFFDQDSKDSVNVEARGACVIGFDLKNYPKLPHDLHKVQEEIEASLDGWIKKVNRRLKSRNLHEIEIEIFLVPVPSAQDFRNAVMAILDIPIPEIPPKKAKKA